MSLFIYVLRPIDLTASERIEQMLEGIVLPTMNHKTTVALVFDEIFQVVSGINPAAVAMPVIDWHGYPYKHLQFMLDAIPHMGDGAAHLKLVTNYIECVSYVVSMCWYDLRQILVNTVTVTVANVLFRSETIVLWGIPTVPKNYLHQGPLSHGYNQPIQVHDGYTPDEASAVMDRICGYE